MRSNSDALRVQQAVDSELQAIHEATLALLSLFEQAVLYREVLPSDAMAQAHKLGVETLEATRAIRRDMKPEQCRYSALLRERDAEHMKDNPPASSVVGCGQLRLVKGAK